MNYRKVTYWAATGLLCLLYAASATFYLTSSDMVRGMLAGLGYPGYLVYVLIVVKILGVIAILWRRNLFLSDLAYAGMFFHLLLAISAHLNAGDGGFAPALIGLALLVTSFLTQNAARAGRSPYAPSSSAAQA